MAISQNFPSIAPSLSLNFASSRTLDPRITFTRTSSATCVGPNGLLRVVSANEPRFDHNPTTGESLGLLVEEQRTNLRLNSATYQPTSGAVPAAYTVDQVAPDGTTTGSRQTAATPRTLEDYMGIANALYTFSFYCRVTSGTAAFQIQLKNAQSDTVITSDTSPVATTTWKRFSISGTTNGAIPGARVELVGVVPGFVFWGAQLEAGSFPTSYIPTTTAAATRSADVASITGTAFSSWYRQDEGTVFAETPTADFNGGRILQISDGTGSNRQDLAYVTNQLLAFVNTGGLSQVNALTSNSLSDSAKNAYAYRINDFAWTLNGGAPKTNGVGTAPTVNRVSIGYRSDAAGHLNGTIRRLAYWPARLPNSTLQSITQ